MLAVINLHGQMFINMKCMMTSHWSSLQPKEHMNKAINIYLKLKISTWDDHTDDIDIMAAVSIFFYKCLKKNVRQFNQSSGDKTTQQIQDAIEDYVFLCHCQPGILLKAPQQRRGKSWCDIGWHYYCNCYTYYYLNNS